MVALAFDTLTASKALREAGADQRLAEAIVGIVQRTTEMPDISHLATKDDLDHATKNLVTREELLTAVSRLELAISTNNNLMLDRMRTQGWSIIGGVGALFGIFFALLKLTHLA